MIQDDIKLYADSLMRKKIVNIFTMIACTDDAIDAYHVYKLANLLAHLIYNV